MPSHRENSSSTSHTMGGVPNQGSSNDGRVPISAEPGVYKKDGRREVPLSAEGGVYTHDNTNEPKSGTAGKDGVTLTKESDAATGVPGSKVYEEKN
ncbi:hypothetical protein QQS21_003140 [Conoideocrella luteorostrata]|uniref:Uncharacterized protein n=1 Tax=Conoideocrella luteorostrata TaxID=1105319 RepID=A0AAJ0CXW8_9HYPO|nr:hypothetical protein QQS21_003140 [Conoideocrella luteorostrata]